MVQSMRKLLAALAAVALILVLGACTPEEGDHLKAVNDFRAANGMPALNWDEDVYAKAHAWSEHLADIGKLEHSKLADGVPAGWHALGENVAFAPTLDGAMTALETSPPHRANLLSGKFDQISIGVVQRYGLFWVTEVFIG
ncbi:MAG: hypothetical protein JWO68_1781 [Actinomycetia bacterium]|nr:hypothetical protein [Actinomycetes bacterium]